MRATDLDRYGCILGGRKITYQRLLRYYVCNECGGRITHTFVDGDRVQCGACGGEDFVSEHAYEMQIVDGFEVMQGLPESLRALVEPERETQCQSATEAVAALFDLE